MTNATAHHAMHQQPWLRHFNPRTEFKRDGVNWFPLMDPRWLVLADAARNTLGVAVHISGHPRALGRRMGRDAQTRHNVERWGTVQAGDVFVEGVYTREQAEHVVTVLLEVGFTGVGVYPDWTNNQGKRQVGFHADVRKADLSTWGYVNGQEVSLEKALEAVPK